MGLLSSLFPVQRLSLMWIAMWLFLDFWRHWIYSWVQFGGSSVGDGGGLRVEVEIANSAPVRKVDAGEVLERAKTLGGWTIAKTFNCSRFSQAAFSIGPSCNSPLHKTAIILKHRSHRSSNSYRIEIEWHHRNNSWNLGRNWILRMLLRLILLLLSRRRGLRLLGRGRSEVLTACAYLI